MKNKRVSIKDIAKELNVSVTTVSFVLNGKAKEKRISEEVTNTILEYIEKINYKPNQLAQSLRTGESKILVFMVEDISNQFFSKLARIFEDLAYKDGYKVLFCSNDNDDKKSIELIDLFNDRQVDGFVIIPSAGIQSKIKKLQSHNIPVVLLDRYYEGMEVDYVGIDNQEASRQGAKHLLDQGFKNHAFISIDVKQTQMMGRLEGYQAHVKEHSLKENVLLVPFQVPVSEASRASVKDFFEQHPDLDSILFATNYLTQLGMEVLRKHFPERIEKLGIITFDDNELFTICNPAITAICQPLEDMAKETMVLLLELLRKTKEPANFSTVILKTTLEIRESTLPLAKRAQ
jgi:LacI family transcriptional regulator